MFAIFVIKYEFFLNLHHRQRYLTYGKFAQVIFFSYDGCDIIAINFAMRCKDLKIWKY